MFFATLRNRSPPGPTPQFADLHQIVSSNLARLRVLSQVARAPAPHPPRQCACLRSSSTAAPAPSQRDLLPVGRERRVAIGPVQCDDLANRIVLRQFRQINILVSSERQHRIVRRCKRDALPIRRPRESVHIQARVPRDLPRLYRRPLRRLWGLRVAHIRHPQLVLPKILLVDLIVAVFFLPLFLALAFRARRRKRNSLSIFRPVKSSDIRLLLRQLPPFSALRRNHPNLPRRRLPFPLFFLVFSFLLLASRRHNRATFPLGDKRQPPPVRRPFRRIARFLSSRQWKARPRRHVHQPNLPHVRILLPIRFAHSIRDKSPIRRDARPADRLQTQRFLQRRRMLRLRVERATAKKTKCHHQDPPNKFVHKAPLAYFNGVTQNPRTQTASVAFSKTSYRFFSPEATRRFALINTSAESGRPFQKSSRTRPSASRLTVAGIALAVRYHPSGNTTALRGRPRLRSNTKSSPSKR